MTQCSYAFDVSTTISQDVEITKPGLTPEELILGLNEGKYITTISYGSDREPQIVDENLESVADILGQDNIGLDVPYENFELSDVMSDDLPPPPAEVVVDL